MLSRWSKLKSQAKADSLAKDSLAPELTVTPLAVSKKMQEDLQSRTQAEAQAGEASAEVTAEQGPQKDAEHVAVDLPNISDLTKDSDFTPFMQQGVPLDAKNAALRKLFTDPHFNEMDGLDIYIDDYGKPDPIPEAMLKRLLASKFLGLDEPEEGQEAEDSAVPTAEGTSSIIDAPEIESKALVEVPVAVPHDFEVKQ